MDELANRERKRIARNIGQLNVSFWVISAIWLGVLHHPYWSVVSFLIAVIVGLVHG